MVRNLCRSTKVDTRFFILRLTVPCKEAKDPGWYIFAVDEESESLVLVCRLGMSNMAETFSF